MQSAIHRAAETPLQTRLREELKLRRARMSVKPVTFEVVPVVPDENAALKEQDKENNFYADWLKRAAQRIPTHEPTGFVTPPVPKIIAAVGRHYGFSTLELVAMRRTKDVVVPRQVAMYLSRKLTPRSLPQIGRHFLNRDHTTILHSVRNIERLLTTEGRVSADIAAIKAVLE